MPPAKKTTALSFRGIFPPLVTPFRGGGSIDQTAFLGNFEHYEGCGLSGYVVLGSNGEAVALTESEKLELVEAARAATRRPLIVGTGLHSTGATIDLTRKLAEAGADAALVLTPYYYRTRMTVEALRRHFEAVADASPIPILLYSVPAFTGLILPADLVPAVSAHEGIVGVKESSGDVELLSGLVASAPEGFSVMTGSAPALYPSLARGATGAIIAIACCAPRQAVGLYDAFVAGDHSEAAALQAELTPLAKAVTSGHGVAGLKAAMDFAGMHGGEVRAPLLPLDAEATTEIEQLFEELGRALQTSSSS